MDTKTLIFNTALRMFAQQGYEKVSIRAIADAVGIKTASIYYHYTSKEEILDACFNFFIEHRYETRLSREQYEPILRQGTKEEVMEVLNYAFREEVLENMIYSLLTVFAHMYTDKHARDVYVDDVTNSMKYMNEFFLAGIEVGRFAEFNVSAISLMIISTRMFSGQYSTLKPEESVKWLQADREAFNELTKIIPFMY